MLPRKETALLKQIEGPLSPVVAEIIDLHLPVLAVSVLPASVRGEEKLAQVKPMEPRGGVNLE